MLDNGVNSDPVDSPTCFELLFLSEALEGQVRSIEMKSVIMSDKLSI